MPNNRGGAATNFEGHQEEDQSMKQEYYDNTHDQIERKRKRWILIGIIAFTFCIALIIAIAVPITVLQKNNKQKNLANSKDIMNAASAGIAGGEGDGENMMIKQQQANDQVGGKLYIVDNNKSQHPPAYAHAVSPFANLTRLATFSPPTNQESRIFVMGDVHGCLNEMNELLNKIQFQPNKDVLILTGDLVFRGQDSLGVIRRARELNAHCVRGNHDDKVIRLKGFQDKFGADAMSPPKQIMPEGDVGDPLKFKNKHVEIARMLNTDDYAYLTSCPLILDVPDLNARVVHGGLDPAIENIIDNDPWSVMNMRDMDSNNEPSKEKLKKHNQDDKDIKHWTTAYQEHFQTNSNAPIIYYGHDASRGLLLGTQTIGVDSGCVYGRKLSAIDMRSKQLYQVDCDNVKSENKKDRKADKNDGKKDEDEEEEEEE